MKRIFFSFSILIVSLALTACNAAASEEEAGETETVVNTEAAEESAVKEGPAYTSAYVCPMHCKGSGSDQPGACPACGMDYVARAELDKREGHSHDGHGHDHHH